MPEKLRRRRLYVRCARLADLGRSNNRPGLHPVARSHPEICIQLLQARAKKMGDADPALVLKENRAVARVLRQRRRTRRPAKRAFASGNVPLNESDRPTRSVSCFELI
jgi:hypothetical protein